MPAVVDEDCQEGRGRASAATERRLDRGGIGDSRLERGGAGDLSARCVPRRRNRCPTRRPARPEADMPVRSMARPICASAASDDRHLAVEVDAGYAGLRGSRESVCRATPREMPEAAERSALRASSGRGNDAQGRLRSSASHKMPEQRGGGLVLLALEQRQHPLRARPLRVAQCPAPARGRNRARRRAQRGAITKCPTRCRMT